ncbi:MAG: hypothetical protein KGJ07_10405, partial [Patescibacteria group bacterium]|nr:hypothetical protein [Patescibacteria group bacterium]
MQSLETLKLPVKKHGKYLYTYLTLESVSWHRPNSKTTDFELLFFLPKPYHPIPNCYTRYNAASKKPTYLIVPLEGVPENTRVGIHVYAYRTSKEIEERVQYRVGTAWCAVKDLLERQPLPLCNEEGSKASLLGEITLHPRIITPWIPRAPQWIKSSPEEDAEEMLKNASNHHPIEYTIEGRNFRSRTGTIFQGLAVPVWMFQQPGEIATPLAYYERVLDFALLVCGGISKDAFRTEPHRYPEVLGQFLGYYAWTIPYCLDRNEMGKPYDQFSMVRDMPDPFHHSGDCEDFAREMQLAFYWLMHHPQVPDDPYLGALLQLARCYTCFTV